MGSMTPMTKIQLLLLKMVGMSWAKPPGALCLHVPPTNFIALMPRAMILPNGQQGGNCHARSWAITATIT